MSTHQPRPDYGVDGSPYIVGLLAAGAVGVGAGPTLALVAARRAVGALTFSAGALALASGLLGLRYVRVGKFTHRDRLLDVGAWRGDERVLDVGTGDGLLLVGAAKRCPRASVRRRRVEHRRSLGQHPGARRPQRGARSA